MSDHTPVITLNDGNFSTEVIASPMPVLVDVWAPWCGPCRMVAPLVEALAIEFEGQAKVGKLNADQYEHTAGQLGIQAIPTLLLFKDGKIVDRVIGVAPKEVLAAKLQALLQPSSQAA